ncbi:MAG: twin transmembrane helix small protein [Alphaproteobacteria bacterium]|nr:twin transmembrane helix small protein [Alphaproteobacteria bacterium]
MLSSGRQRVYVSGMGATFYILMVIAMLITLGVLGTGLFAMARGGEMNKKWSNRLMRYRVYAQGVALLFFALAMLAK